jgi:L-ornithine N5-oxygenase
VNEIFDPDRVDGIYNQDASARAAAIALDRGTNYGVVRLELLEHLYEKLYMQNLRNPDESKWPARILTNRTLLSASQSADSKVVLKLGLQNANTTVAEELEVDYVFTATGYRRNAHEELLSDLKPLLPESPVNAERLPVSRDYQVQYDGRKIDRNQTGIWLQGCNEETHGVRPPLLSAKNQ